MQTASTRDGDHALLVCSPPGGRGPGHARVGTRMRTHVSVAQIAATAFGLVLLWERPALAYIDPGSGSLLYQAFLAIMLGAGVTFRRTLSALLRWRRPVATPPSASSHDGDRHTRESRDA